MSRFHKFGRALFGACICFFSVLAHADVSSWSVWFNSQIEQHPQIVAAREQLLGTQASADAAEQPLFNPELSTDLERNAGASNYRVGVRQTIDWWDQRGAQTQKAMFMRGAAEALYRQQLLEKSAEAISALVEWEAASQAASITKEQKNFLDKLLEQVDKRQRLGDLGSVDAELTFLSLSERLAQVAEAEAAIRKAEIRLAELLPEWTPEKGGVPAGFWPSAPAPTTDQDLLQHPAVAGAQARWQTLTREADVVRLSTKAKPTFGVNAGRDGGEHVVGVAVSIPLNVRNNFSAETRAASQMALEAEARFQDVYRKQRFSWRAAHAAWWRYAEQYDRWQELVQGRIEKSSDLLRQQWNGGDLSTTEYLQALNQRADSLSAGIALEKQARLALADVLLQSGELVQLLDRSNLR
ncbi:MAG: TolC family protein [Azoarcus sp.]|nr:TolC family protein [Azoarcus sp.]|tara:strand:- start:996 stop:2228 length:1233 start_codon:yes stop_codon:yes gene_type:complete